MSKIFCEICGTAYNETATQCPICGSPRPASAEFSVDTPERSDAETRSTPVKGGRFSKSNVNKRLNSTAKPKTAAAAAPARKRRKKKKPSTAERVLTIARDLKSITVECFVTNPSEFDIGNVGFRWYFMPSAWNNANGGHMEIGPQKITRPHGYSFYKKEIDSVSEDTIRRIFLVKSPSIPVKTNSNQLSFKSAKTKTLTVTLHPAALFGGVAVWDTPDLFAATCEPFYKPVTIPPGGTVSYKAELKVH